MRYAILVSALTLSVGAGPQPAPSRPLPPDVGAGRIAWFDLSTTDLEKSKIFYGALFDWTFGAVTGSDLAAEIRSGGMAIGTLRVASGAISQFNGVVYVQVADLPAKCTRAKELGGTLVPGFPFDLPNGAGSVGLIIDPSGHPIGMYSRTGLPKNAGG